MAQPDTLDRRMTPGDHLVLTCRGKDCGARYVATRAQALRRFGGRATAYEIEQVSRCPVCGGKEIMVSLAQQVAEPAREEITYGDVKRLGLGLGARCAPCRHGLTPRLGKQHIAIPLAKLFERRLIRCHVCGLPACGLTVERPMRGGGGGREAVHAFWEVGSPADPAVQAFWGRVAAALKQRPSSSLK